MRISDWSSDVCSSDLRCTFGEHPQVGPPPAAGQSATFARMSSAPRENELDRLDDIEAFLAIVEKGSQTAAARHLRRSLQSVSRSLATLEEKIGRAHVRTPGTTAQLVCRLRLEKK